MPKMLKFGGPNLKGDAQSTWYDHRNADGSYGGQIAVRPGDMVEADRVGGIINVKDETGAVVETFEGNPAAYYVETGRGSVIDAAKETTPAKP